MADDAPLQFSLFGDDMTPMSEVEEEPSGPTPAERAAELNEQLARAAYQYYALDAPEMTDVAFDRLLQELIHLEEEHPELRSPESYTQRVGGYVGEQFEAVTHAQRMYSMDDAMDLEELDQWLERTEEALAEVSDDQKVIFALNKCDLMGSSPESHTEGSEMGAWCVKSPESHTASGEEPIKSHLFSAKITF